MSRSYSLVQQLYTAEEIGTAGTISAIAFYYRDVYKQPFTKKHTRVYLKQTDSSSLSGSTTEAVSENNGYTQVYDGPFSATGEGWIYLQLSTPYEYDGNQNLIVCKNQHEDAGVNGCNKCHYDFNGTADSKSDSKQGFDGFGILFSPVLGTEHNKARRKSCRNHKENKGNVSG